MAFQFGHDTVLEAMNDPVIRTFMQKTLYDEVIPGLTLPREDLMSFAQAVTERFCNPYIRHMLTAICLNCVSKWRARCMPSLLAYVEMNGTLPEHLAFSLAAMMSLYHGGKLGDDGKLHKVRACDEKDYELQDDKAVLDFFASSFATPEEEVHAFLSNEAFFGQDLTRVQGLEDYVAQAFSDILARGMQAVVSERFPVA